MPHLLAAIDDSAATGPVVALAQWFAALLDVEVVALHVSEDGDGLTAQAAADAAGVKFELRDGDPAHTIRDAATDSEVRAIAIGARGLPAYKMPAGHVALDLIRSVAKPVIVVPPDVRIPSDARLRVLAPVDEDPRSAAVLRRFLEEMHRSDLELVLLRVFDAEHMPMFADHGTYDADIFVEEFVRRTVPSESARTTVEMRVGHPARTILAVERELASDVVVLGWGRNLTGERASVVKRLLAHSRTPLILLPASQTANDVDTRSATSRRQRRCASGDASGNTRSAVRLHGTHTRSRMRAGARAPPGRRPRARGTGASTGRTSTPAQDAASARRRSDRRGRHRIAARGGDHPCGRRGVARAGARGGARHGCGAPL
jgi:hypothetical protein